MNGLQKFAAKKQVKFTEAEAILLKVIGDSDDGLGLSDLEEQTQLDFELVWRVIHQLEHNSLIRRKYRRAGYQRFAVFELN